MWLYNHTKDNQIMPAYSNHIRKRNFATTCTHDMTYGFDCDQCKNGHYLMESYDIGSVLTSVVYVCNKCHSIKHVWYKNFQVKEYLDNAKQ